MFFDSYLHARGNKWPAVSTNSNLLIRAQLCYSVKSRELSLLASQDSDLQPLIFLSLTLQPSCLPSTVMYREQHHTSGASLKYRRRYLNLYSLGCSRIGCNNRYIQSGYDRLFLAHMLAQSGSGLVGRVGNEVSSCPLPSEHALWHALDHTHTHT